MWRLGEGLPPCGEKKGGARGGRGWGVSCLLLGLRGIVLVVLLLLKSPVCSCCRAYIVAKALYCKTSTI